MTGRPGDWAAGGRETPGGWAAALRGCWAARRLGGRRPAAGGQETPGGWAAGGQETGVAR